MVSLYNTWDWRNAHLVGATSKTDPTSDEGAAAMALKVVPRRVARCADGWGCTA